MNRPDMMLSDAVLSVILCRYIRERTEAGERVTVLAADKIAAMAVKKGVYANFRLLGFNVDNDVLDPLLPADLQAAVDRVNRSAVTWLVNSIAERIDGRSVADVELMDVGPLELHSDD